MKRTLFAVVIFIVAFIIYCALFGAPLHAQRTNTIYVDQMQGSTVAAKTVKAQAQCLAAVKCVLIFDPILGGYALGTMPSKGANEFWADYAGITGVSDLGGTVSSGLADPGANGPIKRTSAGVTAAANSSDLTGVSYCLDTSSSTTAYACSLTPAIPSYVTGACHRFKAVNANTAAASINFNSLGAKTIKKLAGGVTTDIVANDIRAGQVATVCYDGTNMQMQSQLGNSVSTNITSPHAMTIESQTDGHSYTFPDNDAFIAGHGFTYYAGNHTLAAVDIGNAVLMDCGAPCTLTLPGGLPVANFSVVAIGSSAVTVALSGSISYNGVNTGLSLTKQSITAWWDGNNYWGTVPIVASTNVTVTPASNQVAISAAGGGGGTPAGSDTYVQYNDTSSFGGDSGFTYNKTTHVVGATGGFQAGATGGTAANGIDIGAANAGCITFEGATADAFEGMLCPPDPTADWTWSLPNATTKIPVIPQVITVSGPTAPRTYTMPDANAVFFTDQAKTDVLQSAHYCTDAGANDTYACNLSPAISAYTTGVTYRFLANTANTGAATINLNSLGAKTIKKKTSGITTDLADNDVRAGAWVVVVYDGTNMQCVGGCDGNAATGSGYATVQDEGTPVTQRTTMNFTGAGVTCTDVSSTTTCNIPSGSTPTINYLVWGAENINGIQLQTNKTMCWGPYMNGANINYGHQNNYVQTTDLTNNVDFGVYTLNGLTPSSSTATLLSHRGNTPLTGISSGTQAWYPISGGGTVTINSATWYLFCATSNSNVAFIGAGGSGQISFYNGTDMGSATTSGALNSSFTLPASPTTWGAGRIPNWGVTP